MRRFSTAGHLKSFLLVPLCMLLASWFFMAVLPAYALPKAQHTSTCPAIPANFDYAHATKEELHHYLLPARPDSHDTSATNEWQQAVQRTIKTGGICASDHPQRKVMYHGKPVYALVKCASAAPAGTGCFLNWNGWNVGNNTAPGFNDAVGQWNIECVTTSKSPSDSMQVSWVGLGGIGENLWQVGTGWDSTNGYYLFYEAVGKNGTGGEVIILNNLSCGTHTSADLWFSPGNPASGVGFHIISGGIDVRGSAPPGFSSGYKSAEWIDERPSCGTDSQGHIKLFKLADYNYSQWTSAQASPNNATAPFYPISHFARTRNWMERNDGYRIANATSLGSDGESFNGNWEDNGDSQCG